MFTKFEEGNLLSETCDDAGIGDKSDDDSIMTPLLSKEEINVMDSGDEYEDKPISTDTLEDIRDGSQSNPSVNRREERYKILFSLTKSIGMETSVIIYAKNG